MESWPSSQPSSFLGCEGSREHELENLETDKVHAKHIILLQSGKDLVNCKVVCLKSFFQKLFQDLSGRVN